MLKNYQGPIQLVLKRKLSKGITWGKREGLGNGSDAGKKNPDKKVDKLVQNLK